MKITHFSTADNEGGSARSAYRIHGGLRGLGHKSKMLVGKKVTQDPDVELIAGSALGRYVDLAADKLTRLAGLQYLYVPSSNRVLANPYVKNADVFQLFNTHGGYFSHKILSRLSAIAPIVWRLSDMWPLTAHSAYAYGCECYKKGVEFCVCDLKSYPPIYRDTKKMLWDAKARLYAQSDITVVAPSSWIENAAKESILFSHFQVRRIPNGIDLEVFCPRDRQQSRQVLGVDPAAKVILFSAHGLDANPRKGSHALIEALNILRHIDDAVLLLVGCGGESFLGKAPMPVKILGYVKDRKKMSQIYSAADLIAVPSAAENLPNNLLESMACAAPAVAFDAGGIRDAVRHMETGYLAKANDAQDFARGLRALLNDDELRGRLGASSRKLIENEFDQKREVKAFESLYFELIEKRRSVQRQFHDKI